MATNSMKGRGKREGISAVIEAPPSEKDNRKPRSAAVRLQGSRASNALTDTNGASLLLTPSSAPAIAGQPMQLQITALEVFSDQSQSQDVTALATWSASPNNAVTFDPNTPGLVTGVSTGNTTVQVTVTADYDDLENTMVLNVTPAVPSSIKVIPVVASIPVGTTQQFTAQGLDANQNVIPITNVRWSSDNPTVVTIDANSGLATAVAQGKANLSAVSAGVTGNAVLTVDAASLQSVSVQPPTATVGSGEVIQLTATAIYSDGTQQDVTAQANWTSSAPTIATVSMGQVTGALSGNASVQASYSNLKNVAGMQSNLATVTVLLNFPDLGAADSQAFANGKARVNQLLTAFERRGNLADAELAQLQDGLELVTQFINNNPSTPVPNFNAASKAGNAVSDLSLLAIAWNSDWTKGPIGTGSRKANVIDDRYRAICDYLYGPPPLPVAGLEHDPGSFPGGTGQYSGLTYDQLRVAAIYGYVLNSQAAPPPYRAVPSPLIADDPNQRNLFNQTVEAADAKFRSNQQLYAAALARLIQTSQMPQINVADLAEVVDILVQQGTSPSNPQLNIWIDRALATAQNVGQAAPPSQISISLPDLEQSVSSFEIIPDNIFALQPAYFCSMLEELKVFQAVEKLVELFQNGVLPVVKGSAGNLLFSWWKNAALRVSEAERRGFYARSLGFPGGDADSPNREFKDLFMRFVAAVSSFVRQNTVDNLLRSNIPGSISQQQVRKSARDLATNISSHGYGIAYPMATELQKELTDVMNILTNGEIQGAYGAKDMWQLVDQVAALELGGNKNSVKYRTMASAGAVVFAWLANKATLLATNSYVPILDITQLQNPPSYSTKPTTTPSDFDLVGACDQWLAVTGTQEDTVEQQAQPVEAPVMPSRPIQIPSVARDMLDSVGIPAMSYAAGTGNGKAQGSYVNWRMK
jgi:hypothetical protein